MRIYLEVMDMKKITILFLAMFFVLSFIPGALGVISTGYKHSYDYYAVTYDGEGDAIVSARLTVKNTYETESIDKLILEFPKAITIYDVVQEYQGGGCLRYRDEQICEIYSGSICQAYTTRRVCDYWSPSGSQFTRVKRENISEELLSDATLITIVLPEKIAPNNENTIVISYKVNNYAKRGILGYGFDFASVIDNNAALVENVRVAVNVQEGLYLKGGESEVNYKPDVSLLGMQKSVAESGAAMDVASYREYSSVISTASGFVKTASYLDPGESFHVKGYYSKSQFSLYLPRIIGWLAVIGAVVFIIIVVTKKALRFAESKAELPSKKGAKKTETQQIQPEQKYFLAIFIGFVTAFILSILTVIGVVLLNLIARNYYFRYGEALLIPIIILVLAAIWLIGLFGPGLYIGQKYGALPGLLTFVSTVIFLLVFAIIYVTFISLIGHPPIYY